MEGVSTGIAAFYSLTNIPTGEHGTLLQRVARWLPSRVYSWVSGPAGRAIGWDSGLDGDALQRQ
jgi:hypothetical protein